MKKIIKILIGVSLILLLIGTVSAFEIKELKTLDDYDAFDVNGCSNYTTNHDRYFLVEKIHSFDEDFIDEWFNNHTDMKYSATPVEGDIYYCEDGTFEFYCYQEVVTIDGEYYMVSINQGSKLSPGEMDGFLKDLKEFNKLNNLETVSVT